MKSILFKNTTISYTDSGKGTALVLLHGFLENSRMWHFFDQHLSKKYRIIAIDLLGHGKTEPMGYVHSMEDNADVVQAVLSTLRIRKAVLVGHSLGGYVALAFAELYPDHVKGLMLVNSTSLADSDEKKHNRNRAITAVKYNYANFVGLAIGNLFSENNREKFASEIEQIKDEAMQTPLQGIVATLEGMKIRIDREVLLHFAPYPIAMILGRQDPVLNYEESISQIDGTSVQLITFPDGHMSPIENRDEMLDVFQEFMRKIK